MIELQNEESTIKPPTECDARTNPNYDFKVLNQHSHTMDWIHPLLAMTPAYNLENNWAARVIRNGTSKFAISNQTAYSNTKAMM